MHCIAKLISEQRNGKNLTMEEICRNYQLRSTFVSLLTNLANIKTGRKLKDTTCDTIVKNALVRIGLVYELLSESVYAISDGKYLLLVLANEADCSLYVAGCSPQVVPAAKRKHACFVINELNSKLPAKCFIDADGNFVATQSIDTKGAGFSERMVLVLLARVYGALRIGHEKLLRYY